MRESLAFGTTLGLPPSQCSTMITTNYCLVQMDGGGKGTKASPNGTMYATVIDQLLLAMSMATL